MRKKVFGSIATFGTLLCLFGQAHGQLELYTVIPPFVSRALPPNVMLLIDNSISMTRFAYFDGWDTVNTADDNWGLFEAWPCTQFDSSVGYYGYFKPDYWYIYDHSHFVPTAAKTSRAKTATEWDGNFLNWLTMRRTDVLRRVLVGGIVSGGDLVGQDPIGWEGEAGAYRGIDATNASNFMPAAILDSVRDAATDLIVFKVWESGNTAAIRSVSGVDTDTGTKHTLNITRNIAAYVGTAQQGIVQTVGDRVRWGITFFSDDSSDGATVRATIAGINASAVYNEIENTAPDVYHTPLAEGLWSVTGYFAQRSRLADFPTGPGPDYSNDYPINLTADPMNYGTGGQADFAWCGKNFVILITDGEPCGDDNLPPGLENWAHGRSDYNCDTTSAIGTDCYIPNCSLGGAVPGIEDVSLYAHTSDLRPDLSSTQPLDIYIVHAFGAGSQLLKYAAINGGFTDQNGNGQPDGAEEWDENGDGDPDNFYEAYDGYQLEEALLLALTDIFEKVASGTGVSVLATSGTGEGALFQAFFRPTLMEGIRKIDWLGYLHGLWVDRMGNLREDTNGDHRLVYTQDKIMQFTFGGGGETVIERYSDSDGDGNRDSTTPDATVPMSQLKPIWAAGELLAFRDPSTRTIKTFIDRDNDGIVDAGEFVDFDAANQSELRPYLRAADNTEAQNIINFIRGEQIAGYRDREVTVDGHPGTVWKLGDIVYSTPTVAGRPESNFNFIYGDASFVPYYESYENRDIMVYVGANDGMLHAFWAGKFHDGDDPDTGAVERGWYSDESNFETNLGDEDWAYIPYNLLPHLKWLTDRNYAHVYYVDQKPRVADVKIFTPDANHPNGWGTILIGGMRLGGGTIQVTDNFGSGVETRVFRSAYFAFDITVPEAPRLLWEFTDPSLGLTTSYPTIAKINDSYFLVFGSGPTNYNGTSDQQAHVFVIDLLTGGRVVRKVFNAEANGFFSDPIAVDVRIDYNIDAMYIGETYASGTDLYGKMYRLATIVDGAYSTDPNIWSLSTLFSTEANQPITAGPASSVDEDYKLWVYFGTGKYMSPEDKYDINMQSFYGMKDPCHQGDCTTEILKADLFNSTDVHVLLTGEVTGAGAGINNWGTLAETLSSAPGWYIDLFANGTDPSERVISKAGVLGGVVFFTTFTPNSDICGFGGNGTLYALNFQTGSPNREPVIGDDGNEVASTRDLGFGVPSRLAIHVGEEDSGATGYVQTSTGAIEQLDITLAPEMAPGIISWREFR